MRQNTKPALVQIMALRLFGAKPLSETIQAYCCMDHWDHISIKFKSSKMSFSRPRCVESNPRRAQALLKERRENTVLRLWFGKGRLHAYSRLPHCQYGDHT